MRKVWERWCVYRNEVPPRVKQISLQGSMCLTSCLNVHLCRPAPLFKPHSGKVQRSHRSCSISLFCRFHCSLKSVENSCQTEKKVLSETSFSPDLGLTEKDTVNSKKLRGEKKRQSEARDDQTTPELRRPAHRCGVTLKVQALTQTSEEFDENNEQQNAACPTSIFTVTPLWAPEAPNL